MAHPAHIQLQCVPAPAMLLFTRGSWLLWRVICDPRAVGRPLGTYTMQHTWPPLRKLRGGQGAKWLFSRSALRSHTADMAGCSCMHSVHPMSPPVAAQRCPSRIFRPPGAWGRGGRPTANGAPSKARKGTSVQGGKHARGSVEPYRAVYQASKYAAKALRRPVYASGPSPRHMSATPRLPSPEHQAGFQIRHCLGRLQMLQRPRRARRESTLVRHRAGEHSGAGSKRQRPPRRAPLQPCGSSSS